MFEQIFSWATLLTIVGLVGFYFAGKKKWWCWYINISCQALWFTYAIATEQYAFIFASLAYTWVFTKNAIQWTREHRSSTPTQPIGHVVSMVESARGISVQFKIDDSSFEDGVERINQARIMGTSILGPVETPSKWMRVRRRLGLD